MFRTIFFQTVSCHWILIFLYLYQRPRDRSAPNRFVWALLYKMLKRVEIIQIEVRYVNIHLVYIARVGPILLFGHMDQRQPWAHQVWQSSSLRQTPLTQTTFASFRQIKTLISLFVWAPTESLQGIYLKKKRSRRTFQLQELNEQLLFVWTPCPQRPLKNTFHTSMRMILQ